MRRIEITSIYPGSIAEDLGIKAGDFLVSINGNEIHDVFDYRFFCAESCIILEIEKKDGGIWQFDIEKDGMEDLGLDFKNALLDEEKSCRNKCVFCFIDQLPGGMRETLYFKDDDARLSFLFGNYITTTNLSDEEIDRIIYYRMSPVNISVHTTNPELRQKMLNNRFAGDILEKIKRFASNGITINTQIVLCPDMNDGAELDRTLSDITPLYPELHSVSAVPVGLTRFREGLAPIKAFDVERARKTVDQVEAWQARLLKKYGSRIVYLADELYILAGRELPGIEAYEDFPQIENGVGMVRSLLFEVEESLNKLTAKPCGPAYKCISIAVGVSVYNHMKQIVRQIEEALNGLKIHLYPVDNTFFGGGVTVTGLLTGFDLIRELQDKDLGETLFLCKNMFKAGTDILLDDVTAGELEDRLGIKIQIIDTSGQALIDALVQK